MIERLNHLLNLIEEQRFRRKLVLEEWTQNLPDEEIAQKVGEYNLKGRIIIVGGLALPVSLVIGLARICSDETTANLGGLSYIIPAALSYFPGSKQSAVLEEAKIRGMNVRDAGFFSKAKSPTHT